MSGSNKIKEKKERKKKKEERKEIQIGFIVLDKPTAKKDAAAVISWALLLLF